MPPRRRRTHRWHAARCNVGGRVGHRGDASDSGQRHPARYGQNDPKMALGRKNALFAGSQSGARTWAILASLINTAKLNDLDPHTYLADVLERMISGRTPVNRLDELLAWNWKAARDAMGNRRLIRAGSRVESEEVGLSPFLRPLAQTARAVFPQA